MIGKLQLVNPTQPDEMLARAARPKLALAVPSTSSNTAMLAQTPLPRTPISSSPISSALSNTRFNQRGFSSVPAPPIVSCALPNGKKSILKKDGASASQVKGKKLQFSKDGPKIRCLTPLPEEYYGTWVKMSRDERRWGIRE